MKKISLLSLVFLLLFVNVNAVFAQEMVEKASVVQVGGKDEFQQRFSYLTVENVEWVSQKFGVTPSWIHNEMAKGYLLTDIHEGLLERQHGGSYERYMQLRYANAFETKVRNKRCGPCVKVAVEVGKAAVKAVKPYVDDAVKAARPYVDDAVKAAKQVFSGKGHTPQSGERTFTGYVQQNVPKSSSETKLYTQSKNFNNNTRGHNPDGQFKRFGSNSHGGVSPHVHQPQRNVTSNGEIFGKVGDHTRNGGLTTPGRKDVGQLYDYLNNGKYRMK